MASKLKSKVIKINDFVIDLSHICCIQKSEKLLRFVFLKEFDFHIYLATERDADTILEKCYQMMKGD